MFWDFYLANQMGPYFWSHQNVIFISVCDTLMMGGSDRQMIIGDSDESNGHYKYLLGCMMRPSILKARSAEVEVVGKALWAFQNMARKGKEL